ncbi:hypothetical protein [Merismopedia glauca]|uniref:Uncharacterized protein n=1 Tax=Merismopedia glauca CCAP 1448/3 TaxID=1296344 RepID=A0A2T1C4L3_9CYAN|nr:hypothetical protein [Merismopedia glauca]PSB03164.1 hypothetical protein C7B64_09795 [Merismopedia glauca CCAP 1448/3]
MCQICALAASYQKLKKRDSLVFETKLSSALFPKKLIERANLPTRSLGNIRSSDRQPFSSGG